MSRLHSASDSIRAGRERDFLLGSGSKLVEYRRLDLACSIEEWLDQALQYPGMQLLDLTPRIAVESTQLPGEFHRDPADQIIVATARVFDCPLVTADARLLAYPYVNTQR